MSFPRHSRSGALFAACCAVLFAGPLPAAELYLQDFEGVDGGGLSGNGINSSWEYGVPVNGPAAAQSGAECWATSLSGNYHSGEDSYLTSTAIDLSAAAGGPLVFSWWQYLDTEARFDTASLEISNDGGVSWQRVYGEVSGPDALSWTRHFVMLDASSAIANFRYRFRMRSDASTTAAGWYLDSVRIMPLTRTLVYSENFEADDGGYVPQGVNGTWEHGTPVAGPGAAYSGQNAWGTKLDGFYASDEDSALGSPPIDLGTAVPGQAILLSWRQHLVTEHLYDIARVEILLPGADPADPASWTSAYNTKDASGVVSDSWTGKSILMGPEMASSGFLRFRFVLQADDFFENSGFYVDDVEVHSVEVGGTGTPTVDWPAPDAIAAGTPLGAAQLNASSPVAGTFSYSPPAGTVLPPGTGQVLSATFTPADLLAYSPVVSSVMIDVAEGYEAWMPFPPGTPDAETLPDADYDHDQLSNFVEYGLGLDPTDGANPDAPRFVVIEDGGVDYPGVEFSVRSDDPALIYAVETSPGMDTWTPHPMTFTAGVWTLSGSGPVVHSSVDRSMGLWRLQVRAATPLNAGGRLFMRISVTR